MARVVRIQQLRRCLVKVQIVPVLRDTSLMVFIFMLGSFGHQLRCCFGGCSPRFWPMATSWPPTCWLLTSVTCLGVGVPPPPSPFVSCHGQKPMVLCFGKYCTRERSKVGVPVGGFNTSFFMRPPKKTRSSLPLSLPFSELLSGPGEKNSGRMWFIPFSSCG